MLNSATAAGAVFLYFSAFAYADPRVSGAEQYHLTEAPKTTAALESAIARADADLFDAAFIRCDTDRLAPMITDDFRFVHDKGGISTRAQFLDNLRSHCARVKTGEDFPARRELVPNSMRVWPINNYGALETGVHRFYATLPGKPETLTETGNFMILWKNVNGKWLMSESISYGHELAK